MKKILITSVGSLVGQNILDSLQGRRKLLYIIGTNSLSEAAGNFRCDCSYLVAPAHETLQCKNDLLQVIEKEQPDLIIPGRDDDVVILSELQENRKQLQGRILCGSSAFAHIMYDKVKSYRFAKKYSLPFAPTVESNSPDAHRDTNKLVESYGYPLIAKPSIGNGSRDIRIITNQSQLDNILQLPRYAIQPLFGHAEKIELDTHLGLPFFWELAEDNLYAVQVLIEKNGHVHSLCGFVSKMVVGKCERITAHHDETLNSIALDFANYAIEEGWRGPMNIQFKKDERFGFQAIEMNGRFSGGTSARYFFGFDEVALLLNEWLGETVIPENTFPQKVNVVIKSSCDFHIDESFVQTLESNKMWKA